MAIIFPSWDDFEAVRAATFCFMSADESYRPFVSPLYHVPICSQFVNTFAFCPPGGRKVTTIWPIRPFIGGISSSFRTPFTFDTVQVAWPAPDADGLMSAKLRNVALYSQPGGSCNE